MDPRGCLKKLEFKKAKQHSGKHPRKNIFHCVWFFCRFSSASETLRACPKCLTFVNRLDVLMNFTKALYTRSIWLVGWCNEQGGSSKFQRKEKFQLQSGGRTDVTKKIETRLHLKCPPAGNSLFSTCWTQSPSPKVGLAVSFCAASLAFSPGANLTHWIQQNVTELGQRVMFSSAAMF